MTETDDRHTLAQLGEEQDWQRRVGADERTDIYTRGTVRIRAIWQGHDKLSGASLFHADMYESYTREPKTIRAWFKR